MGKLSIILLGFICIAGNAAADDLPDPPATNILDNAGMLEESKEVEISQKLAKFKETSGMEFFLVTERVAPGRNTMEYAKALVEKWDTQDERMVGVFENLNNTFTIYNSDQTLNRIGENMTRSLILGALRSAGMSTKDSLVPVERIEASVDNVIENFNRHPVSRRKTGFDDSSKSILLLFGVGCLLALLLFLLVRWLEKVDPKADEARETFRDEENTLRPGAPFTISKTQRRQIRDLMSDKNQGGPREESDGGVTGKAEKKRREL